MSGALLAKGRETWRGWFADRFVLSVVAVFALSRFVAVLLSGSTSFVDSDSYYRGFLDLSQVSLTGSQPRPWGVTIWMALWPSTTAITIAQAALAVAAWTFFAREIWWVLYNPLVQRVSLVLVLVLASTPAVLAHDVDVMSESVSISTGILSLAALMRAIRKPDVGAMALLAVFSLWFAMTRQITLIVVLAWVAVAVGMALMSAGRRLTWLAAAVTLMLIVSYAYVYAEASNHGWKSYFGWDKATAAYAYNVGYDPVADEVLRSLRSSDAPRCMFPASPNDVVRKGTTAWVSVTTAVCPAMDTWAAANWPAWWQKWLVRHPHSAAEIVGEQLPGSFSGYVYGPVRAFVPGSVQDLYLGSASFLPVPTVPAAVVSPQVLWYSAALVLLLLGWRAAGWRRKTVDAALWLTALACFVAVIVSVLLIQTPPIESARENAALVILIAGIGVALPVIGADRILARSGRHLRDDADDTSENQKASEIPAVVTDPGEYDSPRPAEGADGERQPV